MPTGSLMSDHIRLNLMKPGKQLMQNHANDSKQRQIEITTDDLPLHCPTPSMLLWNSHPRVFLPIEDTGEALCPYCGTRYTLKGGATAGHH